MHVYVIRVNLIYISAVLDLSQASLPQNLNSIGQGTGICLACLKPHAIALGFL